VYEGTYQLCEQVKVSTSRVDVTDDGFLLEIDHLDKLDAMGIVSRNCFG
jgi:hypothetical protein